MKILFIYTDLNIRGGEISYNLGLGVLSRLLKLHNHKVDLCHFYKKYERKVLLEKLETFKPDLIACNSISPQFQFIKRIIKDLTPYKIFTLCGGPHPSLVPECLEETEGLDAICRGEGEEALLELVEALEKGKDITKIKNLWIKKNEKIYKNPCRPFIEDLDSIPFPDRGLFDYQKVVNSNYGRADFMFTRGCPYNCTYCSNHALRELQSGKYVRFRSVENVLKEIEEVTDSYKIKVVFMQDDVFTLDKDWVYEFCDQYKKRIKIPFMLHTRIEVATKEMFEKLKEAGCFRIAMGIESGNPYIRNEILKRKMTNQQIKKAFRLAKEAGLITKSFNIVGFPFETKKEFADTIKLNTEILPDLFTLTIFDPYPGTKLYQICKEKGYLTNRSEQKGYIPRTDTPLDLPDFPRREILECYRNFAFNVYKKYSLKKALIFKIYYSRFGEFLIHLLTPFKKFIFSFAESKLKECS